MILVKIIHVLINKYIYFYLRKYIQHSSPGVDIIGSTYIDLLVPSLLLMPQFCDHQDGSGCKGAQHVAQVVGGGPSLAHDHKNLDKRSLLRYSVPTDNKSG